jgi:Flp pilus assembly protein TadG
MIPHPQTMMTRSRLRDRRGVAAVEAAFCLPVILTMLLGTWEIGRMVEIQQILDNAVREGGRQAASGQYSNAQAQQVVLNYLQNAGVTITHATVTVTDLTTPGTDATVALPQDQLQVTLTMPFTDVRWSTATLVTSGTTQLSASCVWCSSNNQAYPSNITVPPGY